MFRREFAMQGSPKIIATLNKLLEGELTAADGYLLQARLLDHQGYKKLAARLEHEADDERRHADLIIKRIVFLEGMPAMQRQPVAPPLDPVEMMKGNLAGEIEVRDNVRKAIAQCFAEGDGATREMLELLLEETENDHLLWVETQLRLAKELGKTAWLAEQL
jgi:bacterioferritin